MKKVIVIVGPTAIGKTSLSVNLAKEINAEIINGDSVSLYKKLDIGSAKITKEEMGGIPHYLVDEIDPNIQFSAADFQKKSRELIDKIDVPMIVGGTGLYIKSALYDYDFSAVKRSNETEDKYKDYTNEELYEVLVKLDKDSCETIHQNNRKRVLRAIELANDNNKISINKNKDNPLFEPFIIYLNLEREVLYKRINQRVIDMFDLGLEKEVKDLFNQNIKVDAIGYKEFYPYFNKEIDKKTLIDTIQKNTRHLAKKQTTWFKNQMKTNFYDVSEKDVFNKILKDVKVFLGDE
ncbi:MAG: tRNA (adenosine(37)-N6)-dimethylallyltransferase MiaA [bacterium]